MGFIFKEHEPTTITIPIQEYNELKQAMQYIEDNGHTMDFLMFQDVVNTLISSSQDNLSSEDEDNIFIDAQ